MEFELSTTATFYYPENSDNIKFLTDLGFTFEKYTSSNNDFDQLVIKGYPIIEINNLEELIDFKKKCRFPIIIQNPVIDDENEPLEIEIYDDYRE